MFLHLLIAFLLGIASPSNGNNSPVASSQSIPGDPEDGTGITTDPVTGETGQIRPPKP